MARKDKKTGLTPKQASFVDELFENGHNGTKAIEAAYPDVQTPKAASVMAVHNLNKPAIQAEIQRRMEGIQSDCAKILDAGNMLQDAIRSAYADMHDDNPSVRNAARKFLADISKDVHSADSKKQAIHNHLHLARPNRK